MLLTLLVLDPSSNVNIKYILCNFLTVSAFPPPLWQRKVSAVNELFEGSISFRDMGPKPAGMSRVSRPPSFLAMVRLTNLPGLLYRRAYIMQTRQLKLGVTSHYRYSECAPKLLAHDDLCSTLPVDVAQGRYAHATSLAAAAAASCLMM